MKINVAILGACGVIGQRFVQMLNKHPQFEVKALVDVFPNKKYGETTDWGHGGGFEMEVPEYAQDINITTVDELTNDIPIVFSGLPPKIAGPIEANLAKKGHIVVTKASDHRLEADVPLIIPEVNPQHLEIINYQKKKRNWEGAIITAPNCSTSTLVLPLKPVYDKVGVESITVVTMQAFSGGGYPGIPSLDIFDNVIPFIGGEEEKMDLEPKKLLGTKDKSVEFKTHVYCCRVPTTDGHMEAVFLKTKESISVDEMKKLMKNYPGSGLYTGPIQPIIVREEYNRPQTRIDRYAGKGKSPYTGGMSVTVGRSRELGDKEMSFICLGHNTIRGGAGEAILIAELLIKEGYI